jgi:hypothetical protein
MNFISLEDGLTVTDSIKTEYKTAREIGKVRIGEQNLYFRVGRKVFFIPFADIRRCFRRVMEVPVKMCCVGGDLEIQNIVICGREDTELIQAQLPGEKAAKILVDEIKKKAPHALFVKPSAEGAK